MISLKRLALISGALLAGILLIALTVSIALAQGPGPRTPGQGRGWWGHGPGMMGWGPTGEFTGTLPYGPGMMGGGRGMGPGMMGWGPTGEFTGTLPYGPGMMQGWRGMGPGMMGWGPTGEFTGTLPYGPGMMRGRHGMMGGWRGMGPAGCPGMGGWGYTEPGTGERLTLEQAVGAVEDYLAAYGNPDLVLAEVMEFSGNFYAEVEEESTGIHALELLVDPYTGVIYPEPGPNMMWNTKYGHMAAWWNDGSAEPTADMTVSPGQAQENAQEYLDNYLPGTTAGEAEPFYGYYTLHVLQDGQIVGMLSVNGTTGQVWYHNWHGDFIGMTEEHE